MFMPINSSIKNQSNWFAKLDNLLPSLCVFLVFVALSSWALSSPIGSSPDDDFHLASSWCGLGERSGLCELTSKEHVRLIPESTVEVNCFAFDEKVNAGCQSDLKIFDSYSLSPSIRGSFAFEYPPVFYAVSGLFASSQVEFSSLTMRFVNISVFLLIITGAWVLLPRSYRQIQIFIWVITLVPLGVFLIASNNPSSWAISGIGGVGLGLLGITDENTRRKKMISLYFLCSVFVASGARADSAFYSIITIMFIFAIRIRNFAPAINYKNLVVFAGICISAVFYFSSKQSTVFSTGFGENLIASEVRNPLNVLAYNAVEIPKLWVGVFGFEKLGWLDTSMPAIVWVTGFSVFVFVTFRSSNVISKEQLFSLVIVASFLYFIPMYLLQLGKSLVGEQIQPRYLLPLFVIFTIVALLGTLNIEKQITRRQSQIIFLLLSMTNSVALYFNTKRYVRGFGQDGSPNLNYDPGWWWNIPIGPMTNWALGSSALFAALMLLLHLQRAKSNSDEIKQSI